LEYASTVITDFGEENTRIAIAALQLLEKYNVPEDIVKQGTLSRPPCRFEILEMDGLTVELERCRTQAAGDEVSYLETEGHVLH
jgi:hypothetical protein